MKLREEFIQKCLADFHYELTREQMEQDWFLDKKNPYYKEKDCYIFRTADKCWMEIATKDLDSAFTEPFVAPEKKPKNGFDRLKVKYAKLKAEKEEIERRAKDSDETIRQQGTKISTLTADLANAQGEAREYRNKFEEAVRRMGGFRRFIYGYNIPQFTDEDRWHD